MSLIGVLKTSGLPSIFCPMGGDRTGCVVRYRQLRFDGLALGCPSVRKRSSKKSTSTKPPTASKTNAGLKGRVAELERALTEAHRQQAATTEVLRAIGRSTVNLDAVLHTILSTAARLCDTGPAEIFRRDGDVYRFAVGQVAGQAYREQQEKTIRPGRGTTIGRAVLEKRPIQILDAWDDPEYEDQAAARIENFHTMLAVPLLRDGEPIGAFAAARHRVEPFTESQIKTVSSFADQAVIAIENARLFDELQERTAELAESLQQQTGTAEVLQAISRSTFDRDSILHMLIKTAARICDTGPASIYLRDGEMYRWAASQILDPVYLEHEKKNVMCAGRGSLVGRAALERRPVQLFDAWDDPEYEEKAELRRANLRTILAVPMLRNGEPVGVFCLARERLEPFTESQIKLVSTFADQAVIAIENARLFDEVQKRTGDLTEALQQQTATAEVLQTISRSSFDVDAILQTLVGRLPGFAMQVLPRFSGATVMFIATPPVESSSPLIVSMSSASKFAPGAARWSGESLWKSNPFKFRMRGWMPNTRKRTRHELAMSAQC